MKAIIFLVFTVSVLSVMDLIIIVFLKSLCFYG